MYSKRMKAPDQKYVTIYESNLNTSEVPLKTGENFTLNEIKINE